MPHCFSLSVVSTVKVRFSIALILCSLFMCNIAASSLLAQNPPYDVFPQADPPYYRVRYEAGQKPGELIFPVNYTIWLPPGVQKIKGIVVHQHGCGEGSCKSGLTGAFDLHWQALAKKHHCALMAPSYEQPQAADCQMWCDPRNGSAAAFERSLSHFAKASGHAELTEVPWALWGHSGGGHWVGGMVMLYPQKVIAAWLRSGVPMLEADPNQTKIKHHQLPDEALKVPMNCNLGTKEGYSVKNADFSGVWPANEKFFRRLRESGGLIGVAIDPKSSHECGNQRYLAIVWLDACMQMRLPKSGAVTKLNDISGSVAWFGNHESIEVQSEASFVGNKNQTSWLPNESVAKSWKEYCTSAEVLDTTPPPVPTDVKLGTNNVISWNAEADLESGIEKFLVYRDDQLIATLPANGQNKHGRPLFKVYRTVILRSNRWSL
ncbi:MAG: hypothetical protein U0930_16875 [Pirellulales bacterium]